MAATSSEDWRRIEQALDGVLDLPAQEWPAALERLRRADPELHRIVARLLDGRGAGLLDGLAVEYAAPLFATVAEPATDPWIGRKVGPFRVVREAGKGGMGTVYLAEREEEQFRQRVALKLMRGGGDTEDLARRFRDERQILAGLDHPLISRIVDGSVTDSGVPWLAMEYVDGVPIDRYCDENRLGVPDRIRLFCRVCEVVQFAHRHLVVHRDLKPNNILVTAEGDPRLLDFGIAKLLTDTDQPEWTGPQTRLLTPGYASPEQVRGERVSTVSDVYSLGVLLYRLLTRSHPYPAARFPPLDRARAILDADPQRPSDAALGAWEGAAAESSREAFGASPEQLRRYLRGDLDTIVLKAMARDPSRRYASAHELAEDLRRHLDGQPVVARPPALAYRARKFAGRHRAALATSALLFLLLAGAATVTGVQASRIRAQAVHLAYERDRAEQASAFLVDLFASSDPYRAGATGVISPVALATATGRLDQELAGHPELLARMLTVLGRAYWGIGNYPEARRLLESAVAVQRDLLGDGDLAVAGAMNLLGLVLRQQGDYAAAEALYREVLDVRRRHLGAEDPEVARSMAGLALTLRAQDRHAEAEDLLRQVLEIDRGRAGIDPVGLAGTLNSLGHVVRENGDPRVAEALYREALDLRRVVHDAQHPDVGHSLANVAIALRDQGDYTAAEPFFHEALDLLRRTLGDDHPDIGGTLGALALLHWRRGEAERAEVLYRDALAREQRTLGSGHPRVATTLVGLGNVMLARGAVVEAEPLLRQAVDIRRRALRPGHRLTAEAEEALAVAEAGLPLPGRR